MWMIIAGRSALVAKIRGAPQQLVAAEIIWREGRRDNREERRRNNSEERGRDEAPAHL